jgi:hypothetical protein
VTGLGRLHPERYGATKLPLALTNSFDWQLTVNLTQRVQSARKRQWTALSRSPTIGIRQ